MTYLDFDYEQFLEKIVITRELKIVISCGSDFKDS